MGATASADSAGVTDLSDKHMPASCRAGFGGVVIGKRWESGFRPDPARPLHAGALLFARLDALVCNCGELTT